MGENKSGWGGILAKKYLLGRESWEIQRLCNRQLPLGGGGATGGSKKYEYIIFAPCRRVGERNQPGNKINRYEINPGIKST